MIGKLQPNKAIIVVGARRVGKTVLFRMIFEQMKAPVF